MRHTGHQLSERGEFLRLHQAVFGKLERFQRIREFLVGLQQPLLCLPAQLDIRHQAPLDLVIRLDDLAEFIFSLDVKFADLSMTCQFLERFRQFLKRPDDDSAHGKVQRHTEQYVQGNDLNDAISDLLKHDAFQRFTRKMNFDESQLCIPLHRRNIRRRADVPT